MMNVTVEELAERLYVRRRPAVDAAHRRGIDDLYEDREWPVLLFSLLSGAMGDDDLQPDELREGLRLARDGALHLKSSEYLANRLAAYEQKHFTIA